MGKTYKDGKNFDPSNKPKHKKSNKNARDKYSKDSERELDREDDKA